METPGPGAYRTYYESEGSIKKGITIPGRQHTEKIEMGPGPQTYEPRPVISRDPRPVYHRFISVGSAGSEGIACS